MATNMINKVVFLDRDGVICEKRHHESGDARNYITKWEDFVWIPGSKEAIVKLLENKYWVIVVSNQACVGKGIITDVQAKAIMNRITFTIRGAFPMYYSRFQGDMLERRLRCYICPHTKDDPCSCRKPKPGMILAASYQHNLSLKDAWMVGDEMSDMQAGWLARIRKLIMVGYEEDPDKR